MTHRTADLQSAIVFLLASIPGTTNFAADEQIFVSGIYPHLAMFNNENECGTGAVVPWADRLWVVTYAPHMPKGSSDGSIEVRVILVCEEMTVCGSTR